MTTKKKAAINRNARTAIVERNSAETRIAIKLKIEGSGQYKISTGIRFFDHMLELFTRHGAFDLDLACTLSRMWASLWAKPLTARSATSAAFCAPDIS
jgi:hypothetical protein